MTVAIEEITSQTGYNDPAIRGWIDKLRIKQLEDWSGRPAVAEQDATRIILAIREAGREHAQLEQDYELFRKNWERQKHDAGEEAFQAHLAKHLEDQRAAATRIDGDETYAFFGGLGATTLPIGGGAYAAANEAAHAAREEYARRHPMEDWDTFAKRWRKRR